MFLAIIAICIVFIFVIPAIAGCCDYTTSRPRAYIKVNYACPSLGIIFMNICVFG